MKTMEKAISFNYDDCFKNIEYFFRFMKRKSPQELDRSAEIIKIQIKNLKFMIKIQNKALETAKELLIYQANGYVSYLEYEEEDKDILEKNARFILKKIEEIENKINP